MQTAQTKPSAGVEAMDVTDSLPVKPKCYTREELEPFNLLSHPIWVFDATNKAMWWANKTAVAEIWKADSLEELLARDFTDMSPSTERRCEEYMRRVARGERITDMWTYYPKGGSPVSVYNTLSGLHVEDGRLVLINEAELSKTAKNIEEVALQNTEMLRHLPVAVGQFDDEGFVMEQNPEALNLFGGCRSCFACRKQSDHQLTCHLQERFISKEEGLKAWNDVMVHGEDFNGEIQQKTRQGVGWFAVQMRRSKDPVTGKMIVLYSARDVSEKVEAKNSANAYAQAKKLADEANQAKSEFVAVMAHEMRTPLHQVLGFLELLAETNLDSKQTEYLHIIETSASALMAVINDILDYTKLEAGKMKMENISMDVSDLAITSMKLIASKAEQKGLKTTANIDLGIPRVVGDPNRLRQILLNFFSNAVKFTSDGEICLEVRRLPDDNRGRVVLRFTVADTGIGIHPDHRGLIFNKYQQADPAIARKYGGTGLGLAICKIIVDTLGGDIGVESEVGKGSKFWFQIPCPIASEEVAVAKTLSEAEEECRSLNVLVAEDNKINQKLMKSVLKRLGHNATVVENGLLALEALNEDYFDVILMDVQMPVMDGLQATKRIRESGWTLETLPILGLTADYTKENLYKYTGVGMNDCLGKPVKMDDLRSCLTSIARASDAQFGNGANLVVPDIIIQHSDLKPPANQPEC